MVDIINTTIGARHPDHPAHMHVASWTAQLQMQPGDPLHAYADGAIRRVYTVPTVGDTITWHRPPEIANAVTVEVIEVIEQNATLVEEFGVPHYHLVCRSV
jgi:hypothetical protein